MCSHVLTRVTAHCRVDGHTHVNGQGSPPSQGCLEDGVGRVRPGASVLLLFSKCPRISVGPAPWRPWGQAGREGSSGGTEKKARQLLGFTPKRGLAPPFAARVPAQPGFLSSRGQQAATASSGHGHGTHHQQRAVQSLSLGKAVPHFDPSDPGGPGLGPQDLGAPREWDLSSYPP